MFCLSPRSKGGSKTGWQWGKCHWFCSNLVSKYWTHSTFDLTSLKVRFDYDLALQEGHECLDINYRSILPIAVNKFLIVGGLLEESPWINKVTQINSLGTINVEPTVWLTPISCYGARLAKATLYHGTKVHKTGTHSEQVEYTQRFYSIRVQYASRASAEATVSGGFSKDQNPKKNNQW